MTKQPDPDCGLTENEIAVRALNALSDQYDKLNAAARDRAIVQAGRVVYARAERDHAADSAAESVAEVDRLRKINTYLVDALALVLPLAKGYAPKGQTDSAKRTCRSWIASAEAAIAKANGSTTP